MTEIVGSFGPDELRGLQTGGNLFQGAGPFQYQSLSTSEPEIRLLMLMGKDHSYHDIGYAITCSLFHTSISNLPRYCALSYTWGDVSDPVHSIMIDGQEFRVRENLWQALNRAQRPTGTEVIWVDAICINQEDNNERSEQVRMMRTIYEEAHHVSVWLGPEESNSNYAIDLLKTIHKSRQNKDLILQRFRRPDIHQYLNAQAALYHRTYWGRVWIIQELVLAKKIWVFCGKDYVSWDAFESTRDLIRETSTDSELFHLFFKNTDDWSHSLFRAEDHGPLLIDVTREDYRECSLGLFETVYKHSPKAASDPRDLIYGLLGIVDEEESRAINIDYEKPMARVYIDFAKWVIIDSGRLDILIEVNRHGLNMEDLPSWVPDWSKQPHMHARLQKRRKIPIWNACDGSIARFSFTGENKFLTFEGVNIGRIQRTKPSTHIDDYDDLDRTIETFFSWLEMIDGVSDNPHMSILGLANILEAGQYQSSSKEHREKLGAVIRTFAIWPTRSCTATTSNPVHQRLESYMSFDLGKSKEELEVWTERHIRNTSKLIWDRCCFLTDSGTFGLAPQFAEEGDILCLPFGCVSPFVLRPYGEYYMLVGEAYVHGFMNGEALKLLEKGELKTEDFEIH